MLTSFCERVQMDQGDNMDDLEIYPEVTFPKSLWSSGNENLFPVELLKLLKELHNDFNPSRLRLLNERAQRQADYDRGKFPEYLSPTSEAVSGNWKVMSVPSDFLCRRVEITGPVNSTKMVINMLNRNEDGARADMAMLDFEDSMKPSFDNVLNGYQNVIGAVSGSLELETTSKTYKLNSSDLAYVMVRVRGLHLNEVNLRIKGQPVSAGLLDLATCFFHTAKLYLKQNKFPNFYIPKCEHFLEARWWNSIFNTLEEFYQFKTGTIKTTFLIETLPATYQAEEILYEIKDHAVGLNVGRWDKIFSDIKVLRNHPDRILADRSTLNLSKTWMENYAKRVIAVCHSRGALAIGGMSAFTPGGTDLEREEQANKVLKDKQLEASWGHDGCWVSHPYFIGTAMNAFTSRNQLDMQVINENKFLDVLPQGGGPYTLNGLRTNIRVGIAYLHGWINGLGCVAFDNLMEDLATLEISRAQCWQWLHHRVTLDDGQEVKSELIKKVFDEELEKICQEMPESRSSLIQARELAQTLFLQKSLTEFMTKDSEEFKDK
jgi:malate synthase